MFSTYIEFSDSLNFFLAPFKVNARGFDCNLIFQKQDALSCFPSCHSSFITCFFFLLQLRVNALIKRASLHVQMDDPNRSFEDFERAANLDPSNSDVYHHRGQVRICKYSICLWTFFIFLTIYFIFFVIQMNLLLDKAEEAMRDFARAVELNPTFPIAYVQKCYIDYRYYSGTNDPSAFKLAKKSFEEAIQRFPDCTECYMLYAQVLK